MRAPDAPTGWPNAIAPPSTLSLPSSMRAERARQAELVAAERVVLPRAKAGDHLRGERFVDFPRIDIVEREPVALQQRRRRVHGPETHLRGIERRPLRIDDAAPRRRAVALARPLRWRAPATRRRR